MNKTNFKFERLDNTDGHEDYWFKTDSISDRELTEKYMEQGMIGVTDVVYSKDDDIVGIKRIFPFNFNIIVPENLKLKEILKELVEELV